MIFVFVFVEPVKVVLCGMTSIDACNNCAPYTEDRVVLQIDEATDPEKQSCMWLQATETPGGKCNLSPSGGCLRPTPGLQSALITAVILSFVFICGIACCEKCARQVPTNYIVLFSFTACEAVVLGITCLFADAVAVGMAAGMTGLVTAGLTAFAWFTKVASPAWAAISTRRCFRSSCSGSSRGSSAPCTTSRSCRTSTRAAAA